MLTLAKDGGVSASIWTDAQLERYDTPPPHEIDVCVVGGGIAGLTTGLMLARRGAQLIAESHATAIDWIEATILEFGIACDFRRVPGYLLAPPDHADERALR